MSFLNDVLERGMLGRKGSNPRAEMPFLEHLEELRWRLLWSLLAVVVCSALGFALIQYFDVVVLLMAPYWEVFGRDAELIYLGPADSFFIILQMSLAIGLVLASPIVVYHVWSFLSPALEKQEKRAIVPALYLGLVLFVAGVAMAYFLALEISLRFLSNLLSDVLQPTYSATLYFGFVVRVLLGFGAVFELPVVVMIFSALGLVTPAFLRAKRRWAVVLITVVAAMLSPGDIIWLTALMMLPMFLLYELGILLSELMWRKRDARSGNAGPEGEDPEPPPPPPEHAVAETGPAAAQTDPTETEASPYTHGDPAAQEQDRGDSADD